MNIKLTLPNFLSILRIILTLPVILSIIKEQYYLALILFCLAGITDILDGWIARKFSMQTQLGSMIDPLADKFLLISTFISLLWMGILPLWLFLIIFIRDLIIVSVALGYFIGKDNAKNNLISPSWIGKLNTFLQIFLVVFLIYTQINEVIDMWVTIGFIIIATLAFVSWLDYTWLWFKKFILERE